MRPTYSSSLGIVTVSLEAQWVSKQCCMLPFQPGRWSRKKAISPISRRVFWDIEALYQGHTTNKQWKLDLNSASLITGMAHAVKLYYFKLSLPNDGIAAFVSGSKLRF